MYKACGFVSANQISNRFLESKVLHDLTMASTMQQTTAATEYKDFEPQVDWIDAETAKFLVPGFKRDQMRVQVSSSGNLLVSGQRPLDKNKVSRFRKELQIPNWCDVNGISAKFMSGDVLQIRLPKQTTAPSATEYKDFEPQVDWIDAETVNFRVPGFRRYQMRVQVSSSGKLLVSGQRPLDGNKVSRFRKEFHIPDDCDVNGISVKFMAGDVLQIRLPKQATAPSTVTFVLAVVVVVGALAVGYLSGRLNHAVRDGWKIVHHG